MTKQFSLVLYGVLSQRRENRTLLLSKAAYYKLNGLIVIFQLLYMSWLLLLRHSCRRSLEAHPPRAQCCCWLPLTWCMRLRTKWTKNGREDGKGRNTHCRIKWNKTNKCSLSSRHTTDTHAQTASTQFTMEHFNIFKWYFVSAANDGARENGEFHHAAVLWMLMFYPTKLWGIKSTRQLNKWEYCGAAVCLRLYLTFCIFYGCTVNGGNGLSREKASVSVTLDAGEAQNLCCI